MNLSYWEQKEWLENIDFAIVGSGIVGLSTALFLKQRFPESNITLLEKGILPQGASTKNAGFACFGSLSEILQDLKTHSENEILELVQSRVQGLQLLRQHLGDASIDFRPYGGYELFLQKNLDRKSKTKKKSKKNRRRPGDPPKSAPGPSALKG